MLEHGMTYTLGIQALCDSKKREYERVHCPLMNKTIDLSDCNQRKRDNCMSCLICEDVMAIRKRFINNLIKYRVK